METFKAWIPDDGGTLGDAEEIRAYTSEGAAESLAAEYMEDRHVEDGDRVVVMVSSPYSDTPEKFTVVASCRIEWDAYADEE